MTENFNKHISSLYSSVHWCPWSFNYHSLISSQSVEGSIPGAKVQGSALPRFLPSSLPMKCLIKYTGEKGNSTWVYFLLLREVKF